MKRLNVILQGKEVGVLEQKQDGKLEFRYNEQWVHHEKSRPLSQSLPLQLKRFNEKECAPFFGGLLPEESNREMIAKNLGITPLNDYAMLREIGGECSGAVSLIAPDKVQTIITNEYKSISETELIHLLDQLPERPLLAGITEVRLSLTGAQNKIALRLDKNGYAIPLRESPSTHILKPEPTRFPGLVKNEAYCLKLASAVDLNVCGAELGTYGPHRCLLVTRYDRIQSGNTIHRLHQEDFCQALGISSRTKYQNEGGPGLAQCFDLIRKVSASPSLDLIQLFKGVLFNYLIGNHDAHGKNFSLIYSAPDKQYIVRLAPFYDLVSTAIYPQLTIKMAMKIGKTYLSNELRQRDWELYWKQIGFSQKQALKQTFQFIDQLNEQCHSPENEIQEKIQALISSRSHYLRKTITS